jgi:tetratricopeptide (TPR) repeat protein
MSGRLRTLVAVAVLAGIAHEAQKRADPPRRAAMAQEERVFLPAPGPLKVASLDSQLLVSDVLWVRAVLAFADVLDHPDPVGVTWLDRMVRTVIVLDPGWRSSYMYGGGMLRAVNDIEGSDAVFLEGQRMLPSDPTFPFALAMNAYLYEDDVGAAVRYLNQAAALPGAPGWYRTAAAGFLNRQGQRDAALKYLQDEIRREADPHLRAELVRKYAEVLHDELVSDLEERRAAFEARVGRPLRSPSELGPLPPDPLGGSWIFGASGTIVSSVRDAELEARCRLGERRKLFGLWRAEPAPG